MDDDDDDAHHPPFHQLHHLYTDELQGGAEEEEENDDDDGEEGDEDELEEDDEEGEEDEEDLDDEDEGEDEDDEEEEHEDDEDGDALDDDEFEDEEDGQELQDFELNPRDTRVGTGNFVYGIAGPLAAGLTLFQPDGITAASVKIEGGGDKHSVRDDWTEAATHALLEAWGDRYLQLNKGNLKQEDWEEVAEAVTASSKTHKTDVQCKNRLDTLKKKYKVEKHKQSAIGSADSKWPFYTKLDKLLSATTKRVGIPSAVDAGQPVKSALDREELYPEQKLEEGDIKNPHNTSSSKSKESPDMTFSSPHVPDTDGTQSSRKRKIMETPFKTLAKAITKFVEIYEKMEQSKQQQLMDLEKTRMEFTRDLELQRMQLLMQTQLEIAKMKHGSNDIDATVSNLSG